MTDPDYTKNRSERGHCPVCSNDGWVSLKGTTFQHGYAYSRGAAPCRWCEQGTHAYTVSRDRKKEPTVESDYQIDDVDGYDPDPIFPTKAEAAAFLRSIMPNLSLEHDDPGRRAPTKSPFDGCSHDLVDDGAPQARPWNKDSLQWQRCTKCGMEQATTIPLSPDHNPHRREPRSIRP